MNRCTGNLESFYYWENFFNDTMANKLVLNKYAWRRYNQNDSFPKCFCYYNSCKYGWILYHRCSNNSNELASLYSPGVPTLVYLNCWCNYVYFEWISLFLFLLFNSWWSPEASSNFKACGSTYLIVNFNCHLYFWKHQLSILWSSPIISEKQTALSSSFERPSTCFT